MIKEIGKGVLRLVLNKMILEVIKYIPSGGHLATAVVETLSEVNKVKVIHVYHVVHETPCISRTHPTDIYAFVSERG